MAGTIVQSAYADSSATGVSVAFGASVASSNQLIAFAQCDGNGVAFTVDDTQTNGWAAAVEDYGLASVAFFRCVAPAGGALTVSLHSGGTFNGLTVMEVAGGSTGALDAVGSTNSGSGAAAVTATVSPSTNGLAISGFAVRGNGTITPAAGWTQVQEQESWTNVAGGTASKSVTAGSTSHTWTNPAASWRAAIIVIPDATGGGGGATPVYLRRRALMGVG